MSRASLVRQLPEVGQASFMLGPAWSNKIPCWATLEWPSMRHRPALMGPYAAGSNAGPTIEFKNNKNFHNFLKYKFFKKYLNKK